MDNSLYWNYLCNKMFITHIMKRFILLLSTVISFANVSNAQSWNEVLLMEEDSIVIGEKFGGAVAMETNFAFVGNTLDKVDFDTITNMVTGTVSVYKMDGNGNWGFHQKLMAIEPTPFEFFGESIDVNYDQLVIGTRWDRSVYVFEKGEDDYWVATQKIVDPEPFEQYNQSFGRDVSISGNTIVIGASEGGYDENNENFFNGAGAIYIYEKIDNEWVYQQKLVTSDRAEADFFGISSDISGDYLVSGAFWESEDENGENTQYQSGSAYIFKRDIDGVWSQDQKIVASNRGWGSDFGNSVAIDGNVVLVGSPMAAGITNLVGSGYVFTLNSNSVWEETQILKDPNELHQDYVGFDVDLAGDRIILSAYGMDTDLNLGNEMMNAGGALLFKKDESNTWNFEERIVASNRNYLAEFGRTVGISYSSCVVGAPMAGFVDIEQEIVTNWGNAYIFKSSDNQDIGDLHRVH